MATAQGTQTLAMLAYGILNKRIWRLTNQVPVAEISNHRPYGKPDRSLTNGASQDTFQSPKDRV